MMFSLDLPVGTPAPPTNAQAASLGVLLPPGITFHDCPTNCYNGPPQAFSPRILAFRAGQASADFFVNAPNFGTAFNGTDAAAAMPEVDYHGPGAPKMNVFYNIPSAGSYDWSSFPAVSASNGTAFWKVDLSNGDTAARVAFGINAGAQANHGTKVFIAGAIFGLAGAGILSAIQELLHIRD
jgi:hypothetical protein